VHLSIRNDAMTMTRIAAYDPFPQLDLPDALPSTTADRIVKPKLPRYMGWRAIAMERVGGIYASNLACIMFRRRYDELRQAKSQKI
jgi:hypothetical protein